MKGLLLALLIITPAFAAAFEVDNEVLEQFISTITEEETEDNSTEISDKIENLTERLRFGIDLNNITKDEFNELGIISPKAASEIINYRHTFFHFTTIYELKNIESLTAQELEILKPLVYVSTPEKEQKHKTRVESNTLFSRVIETRKGYTDESTNPYAGDANRLMQKLTIQRDKKLKIGLTTEKDPGELYYHRKWMPLDHCAGYIEVNNVKAFKRTIVGDFRLNFGSGLVFGDLFTLKYQKYPKSNGLYHAGSQAESNYFRGFATEIAGQRLKFTPFISYHTIDATLNPDGCSYSSFYTGGLHRTENERGKADNTKELATGGDLSFTIRKFTLGATDSYYKFSRLYHPQEKPYNYHKPTDTDHGHNISLHYSLMGRNAQWAGEVATSSNGGIAVINQLFLHRSNFMDAKIAHRYYSPDYYAPYANAVKENTRVENEHGMLASLDFYPSRKVSLKLYADLFTFDWIKYAVYTPSYGSEFSSQANFYPNYKHELSLRYRYKNKQKNFDGHLADNETNSLRLYHKIKQHRFSAKTTLYGNANSLNKGDNTYGLLVNEELTYKSPLKRLNITLLYSYFSAKAYANRIYCYEKDIDLGVSSPMNYGVGHRFGCVASARITKNVTFSTKYTNTTYTDGRTAISSSGQEISGNNMNELKAVLKMSW